MSARLSERFDEALAFASSLHRRQKRKSSDIPYVAHLLAVAAIVIENGGSEDEAIAALLHDSIEDQGAAFGVEKLRATIRVRFEEGVLAIVEGCTDSEVEPKPPWKPRKEKYLAHLETASRSVLLVSCADKLHNVRSIAADLRVHGAATWERFNGGKDGSLWYYRALRDVFLRRFPGPLADELARAVAEMDELAAG